MLFLVNATKHLLCLMCLEIICCGILLFCFCFVFVSVKNPHLTCIWPSKAAKEKQKQRNNLVVVTIFLLCFLMVQRCN